MRRDSDAEAAESPSWGISREELLRELYRRMRSAAKMVLKRKPKLVKTVEFVLRSFLHRETQLTLDRFPRQHFCTQQAILVGIFVLHGLQHERLTFLDVREDLGNLAYLLDFIRCYYPSDAAYLQSYLRKYLAILEQLCTILERATQVVRTDWGSLKDVFKDCGEEVPQLGREHMVPMIADIQPLRLLGAGGFGAIYKCILGGAVIAGKLVPLERMRHPKYACVDKMVTSMMNSPFVIRYYSCFATDKAYCTLMEYMRGVDLNRLIKAGDPLDLITIALVFAQLGLAVRYLHFRGFIHRDIKPANVMVLPGCRIKLIDLDTCKVCTSLYGDGYTRSFRNRTYGEFKDSEIAGTMVFFAPETVSRESYGRATDWWALGVTAYCAGTGRVPFRGKNDELKKRIKAAEYRRIRDKPELDHLIERLIQKDPKDRITCARFEEFQEQELFQGIHWENLDGSFLYEVKQLDELMQMNKDGTLSPNPVSERKMRSNRKPRPQLKFSEVTDIATHKKLYTYFTDSFYKFLVARSENPNGIATLEVEEEYDFIPEFKERRKRATYKFQDFLKWDSYPTDRGTKSTRTTRESRSR